MKYEASVRYLLSLGRELAAPTQASATKFDLETSPSSASASAAPTALTPAPTSPAPTQRLHSRVPRIHPSPCWLSNGIEYLASPRKINERIRVSGEEISDEAFAESFTRLYVLSKSSSPQANFAPTRLISNA